MYLKLFNITYLFIAYLQITGLGLFFLKIFGFSVDNIGTVIRSFWLGFAGVIVILDLLHLFWPVNGGAITFIFLLSLAGFLLAARELLTGARKLQPKDWVLMLLALLVISGWILTWSRVRPFRYDTGLYYIQKVNWLVNYPVVKGLGNFYERLAFPHSYFLFAAFLESAYWRIGGFYISSYLMIAAVLGEWLWGCRQILVKRTMTLPYFYRSLLIFPVVLYRCTDYLIVTASPDVTVFLLMLVTTAWLLDSLGPGTKVKADVFMLLAVLMAGMTVKTTFAIFGLTMLAIVLRSGTKNVSVWLMAVIVFLPFFMGNVWKADICIIRCLYRFFLLFGKCLLNYSKIYYPAWPAKVGTFSIGSNSV